MTEKKRWTVMPLVQASAEYLARRSTSARLDAELLLASVLETDRVGLYCRFDRPMAKDEIDRYRDLVRRRGAGEPVAYLIGEREFFGLRFAVDRRVLIPRPETELLVERALALIPAGDAQRVLDIGTGSGAIAVAIAARCPHVRVVAVDISGDALAVAAANAARHGVADRIEFARSDLFEHAPGRFDLVVSNPPYIAPEARETLAADVAAYEPETALFAPERGLYVIRRIIQDAPARMSPGASLLIEIGFDQADAVREIVRASGLYDECVVHPDLAGRDRVVEAKRWTR